LDFIDHLRVIASRAETSKDLIQTEEATKTALILPLIQALGYDVFNPQEVMPELVADIGTKKGEKVDYAIIKDGKPAILFECKKVGGDLNINHASQLFRYFHVTEGCRFAVLTNGLIYKFFTDIEQPNVMDKTPFFEFNILDFKASDVQELKKFAKSAYDLDSILDTANQLKYVRGIQTKFAALLAEPSDELIRLLTTDVIGNRRFTSSIKDQFSVLVKNALEQFIGEKINDRLKGAMTPATAAPVGNADSSTEVENEGDVDLQKVTTAEELEGYHCIKAILRDSIDPKRIYMRDAQSYCAILLDDNNRKPICRLNFNNPTKLKIRIFTANKEQIVFDLSSIDDIFNYAAELKMAATAYL
jgi:predicted type IV restriction endonuclease